MTGMGPVDKVVGHVGGVDVMYKGARCQGGSGVRVRSPVGHMTMSTGCTTSVCLQRLTMTTTTRHDGQGRGRDDDAVTKVKVTDR